MSVGAVRRAQTSTEPQYVQLRGKVIMQPLRLIWLGLFMMIIVKLRNAVNWDIFCDRLDEFAKKGREVIYSSMNMERT